MVAFISACGGGGGGSSSSTSTPVTNQSLAGIWTGSFHSTVLNATYNVTGLVSETNIFRFLSLSTGGQYSGIASVTGASFSSTMTGYSPTGTTFPNGTAVTSFKVSGNVSQGVALTGTYSGGGDAGTFAVNFNNAYNTPSSLTIISGNWSGTLNGSTINVAISDSGIVTGSSTSGCTYSGNVSTIDINYNCYNITITASSCGASSGNYSGLATLTETAKQYDTLLVGVSNAENSVVMEAHRQ